MVDARRWRDEGWLPEAEYKAWCAGYDSATAWCARHGAQAHVDRRRGRSRTRSRSPARHSARAATRAQDGDDRWQEQGGWQSRGQSATWQQRGWQDAECRDAESASSNVAELPDWLFPESASGFRPQPAFGAGGQGNVRQAMDDTAAAARLRLCSGYRSLWQSGGDALELPLAVQHMMQGVDTVVCMLNDLGLHQLTPTLEELLASAPGPNPGRLPLAAAARLQGRMP